MAKSSSSSNFVKPIADMVANIVVGSMQNKTQKEKNEAELEIRKQAQKLNELTAAQKQALQIKIANAKTDTDRLKVYNETITALGGKSIESSADIFIAKINQNKFSSKLLILSIGIGIVLIAGTIYILRKK